MKKWIVCWFCFFSLLIVESCIADSYVYALVAPYPEVTDSVTESTLRDFWRGLEISEFTELVMTPRTMRDLTEVLDEPAMDVNIHCMASMRLLPYAWNSQNCWAIVPFDSLDPRWKVIDVDGKGPFEIGFEPETYFLKRSLRAGETTNFDRSKLTSLTLTGTTAMSRYLAYHIEEDGLLVPTEEIGSILAASDILHISNEASFSPDCPPGSPLRREARFCSLPSYFTVLETVGADVIELTGNHNLDWGYDPFYYSMDMYEQAGMRTYGGGINKEASQEPLLIEHNGNKIAFLGCNAMGPENVLATDSTPGAAPCDLEKMKEQILALKADDWLPVVTFQHFEYTWYDVPPQQSHDFYWIAEQAGPVIVSGSQAHIPQGMTFIGDTFIHFGLGNLFFDQMSDVERTSFFDRHYFYDGRYLGSKLETIILENYSRPRFLTPEERTSILNLIFDTCSWKRIFE